MTSNRTILITGVTGNQGGAVARALEGVGFNLRGLTRKPDSEQAAALARQGVDIVKGDLDDEATLRRALAGVWGVFGVQNAGEAGVEREEAQGKRLATLARAVGVEHFVYTSVGSAHKGTGVPHFDNKWRIEETVRGLWPLGKNAKKRTVSLIAAEWRQNAGRTHLNCGVDVSGNHCPNLP